MTVQQYGNYELVERIARGGMAEVFKARMKGAAGFEKLVALKMLHSHLAEDAEMVASLKDEARLVSNMLHPNICQVLYFEKFGETYCITMEYIHGKDISTLMRGLRKNRQKLPLEFALYIIRQTLTGLDYAHRMVDSVTATPLNIIHRDISPQNILVSYSGAVKIIDFGIAKAAESLHHTQSGVIKGKFRYMAPEQAMGQKIDYRVDIFAAGVVLYEMLMGETHARGATDAELIVKAQTANFRHIEEIVPNLPPGLGLAVMKALSFSPEDRFASARVFRNALDNIVQREGMEVAPEAMASYLQMLFPEGHTGGSRVDEVEQLSGDILELSPLPETGQAQMLPRPPGFVAGSGPMPVVGEPCRRPSGPRPAPLPAHLAPPPTMDFSPPPPPPPEVPAVLPEANPVGLTKATSEKARERRRRERTQKKVEQVEKAKEAETMRVKAPPPPRRPGEKSALLLFIDRLGKAFVNTIVNIFLLVLVVGIGAGILYFTRSESSDKSGEVKDKASSASDSCRKGPVEITLVSDPSDADVFLDGEIMEQRTPWHNARTEMCFNVPLRIRIQKDDLFHEQSVEYPVEQDGRIHLNVKLQPGGGPPVKSGLPTPDSHVTGGPSVPGGGMRPAGPAPEPSSPPSGGQVELAGGTGVLKVTCSAPCTISIGDRNRGSEKVFRLRARKDPYRIQADFGGNSKSEIKQVYVFPNQDNFVHFSPP